MSDALHELVELGFREAYANEYAKVYTSEVHKTITCCLIADYVPIRYFVETFNQISKLGRTSAYNKFIFDKRELRTFHQPSMEWYFLEWKTEMLQYGLTKHRKLLPDLQWFVKAIEIARKPLESRMPADTRSQLDIVYCSSIAEAMAV